LIDVDITGFFIDTPVVQCALLANQLAGTFMDRSERSFVLLAQVAFANPMNPRN